MIEDDGLNLESPAMGDDDDEFGAPEDIPIDPNVQVNHMVRYFTDELAKAGWRIGQHAAEIDALKQRLAHTISERDAWQQMAVDARQILEQIDASNSAGQPLPPELQETDGFLALATGQPGLGDGER